MATPLQSLRGSGSLSTRVTALGGHCVAALVAATTFLFAYSNGTYALDSRSAVAVAVWWAVLVTVAIGVRGAGWSTAALVTGGLIAAFGCWTLASTAWASDAEAAYSEFARVGLYLGLFVLMVLLARRELAGFWADGLALGIVAVALLALASRLYSHAISSDSGAAYLPTLRSRLSYPIGYWNGLGILMGIGAPLLLGSALRARTRLTRGLFLAGLPVLAATIYLTSSRGALATAAAGLLVFVLLVRHRWSALGGILLAGAASAAAIAVLSSRTALANGLPNSSEGRSASVWLVAISAATALLYTTALSMPRLRRKPSPAVGWVTTGIVGLAAVAGAAAAHPIRLFDTFKRAPASLAAPQADFVKAHLLSASGGGRWQFWQAAVSEFHHHPLVGGGAGSYGEWWAEHGTLATSVQNAHSLYLETLGELGIVGFTLLAGLVLAGLAVVVGAARARLPEQSSTAAAVGGGFCAFVLGAGIDWIWQLTAVSVVGVACLALAVVLAGAGAPRRPTSRRLGLAVRAAAVVVALALIAAEGVLLAVQLRVGESQRAARQGRTASAISAARAAVRIQPWAATTHLQLALVYEQAGDLASARSEIGRAIDRNPDGWQLALVSARLDVELGDIGAARKSYARARELNPRSPLFAAAKG